MNHKDQTIVHRSKCDDLSDSVLVNTPISYMWDLYEDVYMGIIVIRNHYRTQDDSDDKHHHHYYLSFNDENKICISRAIHIKDLKTIPDLINHRIRWTPRLCIGIDDYHLSTIAADQGEPSKTLLVPLTLAFS